MTIRNETENDYKEVENVTREAFWNVYRPGCFEHLVIHNLRNDLSFIKELDYVIEEDNKIIGSIVYSKGKVTLANGLVKNIVTFGPLSILPKYQCKGYGSKLINSTLNIAKELGINEIVITGNQEYYKRFGFESASKYGIYYNGLERNQEYPFFMIKIFDKDQFILNDSTYEDPECFNIDEKELEIFDKEFPSKKKEKKEGQLI